MSHEIIEKLKKQIASFQGKVETKTAGEITEAGDGVLKISGLADVMSQEMLEIETEKNTVRAVAFNLEENSVGAIALGDFSQIKTGQTVTTTGKVLSVAVNEEMIGRVVNPLGEPLDNKGPIFSDHSKITYMLVEKKAPSVLAREKVNTPLHTGIKAIDSMIPIGRGQRELIIGDRQTGKTSITLDAIINQIQDTGQVQPICIYVAIGQKEANVMRAIKMLEEKGAMKYTIVVVASAADPASLWFLAPYSGCAIAEYFMAKGKDVLIVYDDLSKHATAYRQISLLLRRAPGREAYPGDVFYLHSRLLERSAKLNKENGGGSLTALPIIETQLGDISSYIPTNVISITDGQVYLESDLFYQGIRPAINIGLSVSRVGSSAQTKAMKKISGNLRLELAQSRELQAFVQFASDLDETTKNKIKRGQLLTEILKQDDASPMDFANQLIVLYASLKGYLDNVPVDKIKETEKKMIEYFNKLHEETILKIIRTSKELTAETEEKLKIAIEHFLNTL
jgi:F-type H+/Na+-transporting ATPase subunit alpha